MHLLSSVYVVAQLLKIMFAVFWVMHLVACLGYHLSKNNPNYGADRGIEDYHSWAEEYEER
jgi:hypothetical protein